MSNWSFVSVNDNVVLPLPFRSYFAESIFDNRNIESLSEINGVKNGYVFTLDFLWYPFVDTNNKNYFSTEKMLLVGDYLINRGIEVNRLDQQGCTALQNLTSSNASSLDSKRVNALGSRAELIEFLIKNDADLRINLDKLKSKKFPKIGYGCDLSVPDLIKLNEPWLIDLLKISKE